jgi:hypothetical protein
MAGARCYGGVLCTVVGLLAVLPAESRADLSTYGFGCITNSSATDAAMGEAQLFMDVSNEGYGAHQVLFTFRNDGPGACSVARVYFDDGDGNPGEHH